MPAVEHIFRFLFTLFGTISQRTTNDDFTFLVSTGFELLLEAYFTNCTPGSRLAFPPNSCLFPLRLFLSLCFSYLQFGQSKDRRSDVIRNGRCQCRQLGVVFFFANM